MVRKIGKNHFHDDMIVFITVGNCVILIVSGKKQTINSCRVLIARSDSLLHRGLKAAMQGECRHRVK